MWVALLKRGTESIGQLQVDQLACKPGAASLEYMIGPTPKYGALLLLPAKRHAHSSASMHMPV